MVWYCMLLMVMLFLYGILIIVLTYLAPNYFKSLGEYVVCITVNSPVLLQSNDTVYRENPYGGVDMCNDIIDRANTELPYFIIVLLPIYNRILWMPIFVILVPHISIRAIMKSLKLKCRAPK